MSKTKTKQDARIMGPASVFSGKSKACRVQGILTPEGSLAFEQARARLGSLMGRPGSSVSDADTIEALARGWVMTRLYIQTRERDQRRAAANAAATAVERAAAAAAQ